ncbi:hypothetical protein [Mycobacteroides abscessus]|uniref:hypothetical protein n=1 Tax=Mycobacteroides abscessus TaxID=36809 RepID=UPI0009414954|nr:hypothetical protein [Mycobacteroides abscessus]
MSNEKTLPVVRTFNFGGIPMVQAQHIPGLNGHQLAEILVRCINANHPQLVHPDAPQLARGQGS